MTNPTTNADSRAASAKRITSSYTLTTRSGGKVRLTTCDTFTLAIGPNRYETTPKELREIFTDRSLCRILRKTQDQSEVSKLRKALQIDRPPNWDISKEDRLEQEGAR